VTRGWWRTCSARRPQPSRPGELGELSRARGVAVIEVNRPTQQRQGRGKSDPADAEAARLALRSVAVRYQQLSAEMAAWAPSWTGWSSRPRRRCLRWPGSPPIPRPRCWSRPATVLSGCAPRPRSRTCAASRRSPPSRARQSGIGCTEEVIGTPTRRCGRSRWGACAGTSGPAAYVARRTAEGKTKPVIIRCLKRFIARELYQRLTIAPPTNHRAAVA
jgi:hypothetical protein